MYFSPPPEGLSEKHQIYSDAFTSPEKDDGHSREAPTLLQLMF